LEELQGMGRVTGRCNVPETTEVEGHHESALVLSESWLPLEIASSNRRSAIAIERAVVNATRCVGFVRLRLAKEVTARPSAPLGGTQVTCTSVERVDGRAPFRLVVHVAVHATSL